MAEAKFCSFSCDVSVSPRGNPEFFDSIMMFIRYTVPQAKENKNILYDLLAILITTIHFEIAIYVPIVFTVLN